MELACFAILAGCWKRGRLGSGQQRCNHQPSCLRPEVRNGDRWTMGAFDPTTNSSSFGQRLGWLGVCNGWSPRTCDGFSELMTQPLWGNLWLAVGRNSYKARIMHIRCSWGLCKKPMVRWGSVVSIVVFSSCCFGVVLLWSFCLRLSYWAGPTW